MSLAVDLPTSYNTHDVPNPPSPDRSPAAHFANLACLGLATVTVVLCRQATHGAQLGDPVQLTTTMLTAPNPLARSVETGLWVLRQDPARAVPSVRASGAFNRLRAHAVSAEDGLRQPPQHVQRPWNTRMPGFLGPEAAKLRSNADGAHRFNHTLEQICFMGLMCASVVAIYAWPKRTWALSPVTGTKVAQYNSVAFDLDGTLLNPDHVINERTKQYLRELSRKGVRVILATGRSLPACYEHVRALDLDVPLPVVCYNGGCGAMFPPRPRTSPEAPFPEPEILFEEPLPRKERERVLALAEEGGVLAQYYHGDHIYVVCKTAEHRDLVARYAKLAGVGHTHIQSYEEVVGLDPCKILLMTDSPDEVTAAGKECFADGSVTVVRGSPPFFVEFLHPSVCKGVGVKRMCQVLAQKLEGVVSFGDGDNDLEMLQMTGKGFAMRNARSEVRTQAPNVTEHTNDKDGVVEELRKLERSGQLMAEQEPPSIAMFNAAGDKDDPQDAVQQRDEMERAAFIETPFSAGKVVTTLLLWSVSLAVMGVVVLPVTFVVAGVDLMSLDPMAKALYLLLLQVVEVATAYAVFSWALEPYQPLPEGWFRYGSVPPFAKNGWATWTLAGVVLAPLAVLGGSLLNYYLGQSGVSGSVQEVGKIVEGSGGSQAVILIFSTICSILAPLMEEAVFRGFLLPSLTKWVPVPVAVAGSSLAFALAHFSSHDLVPLFFLGCVLGTTYVQTRDLLAPTLVHCFWNLLVILVLAVSVALDTGMGA